MSRTWRTIAITTVVWTMAASPSASLAQDAATSPSSALTWNAPPGCIDAELFGVLFANALEVPLPEYAAAGTRIDVVITRGTGWALTVVVRWRDVRRTRTLSVPDQACSALNEALIVVVALLVEDAGALATATPEPLPIALPPPPVQVPVEPAQSVGLSGRLALGATARIDALPGFSAGATVAGEVDLGDIVALGISATYFPPMLTARPDGVGAETSATGGTVYVCAMGEPLDLLLVGGCFGVSAWAVSAAGRGLSEERTNLGAAMDVSGQARADLRLVGPLWVRLEVGVGVALVRTRIYYEASPGALETLHTTSIAFPTASIFLEFRLGDD